MSDYIPDPRRPEHNKFGDYDYMAEPSGRSSFALVALLGIAAVIGGFLYFGGPKPNDQQAQTPPTTMTTPANPDAVPAAPVRPTPPPATPRQQ